LPVILGAAGKDFSEISLKTFDNPSVFNLSLNKKCTGEVREKTSPPKEHGGPSGGPTA
jgi:hypothetical protein